MDQYRLFLQRMGLIGTSNFLIAITGIILLPILTKNLSIPDYGVWTQFQITITLVPSIAILGLPYTMVRFMSASRNRKEIQESFYSFLFTVLGASILAAIILLLVVEPLSNALFNGNTTVGLILPLTVVMTAIMLLFFDFFRASNEMTTYAILTTVQSYMVIFFALILILAGYGVVGAVTGILITQTLISLIMFIMVFRRIGFKIPKFMNLREYLSFGLPTIPSNASFWILDATDRYVVGLAIGITAVGYYSAGYTIGALMSLLTSPLYTVLLPILSQYYAERKIRQTRFLLNYSIKLYLIIAVPAVILLSVLSRPILYILSTPELANEGFIITPILALGGLFLGLYSIVTQILVMERRTRITGNLWIISMILNVAMDITFGYLFGIIGVAITTLFIYLLSFLVTAYFSFKYIRCNFYFGFIAKVIYSGFFMAIVLLLLNPFGVINVILSGIFAFTFYIFVLWLLKGVKSSEIKFLAGVIKEFFINSYRNIRGLN